MSEERVAKPVRHNCGCCCWWRRRRGIKRVQWMKEVYDRGAEGVSECSAGGSREEEGIED
jgi:hypothetical protein